MLINNNIIGYNYFNNMNEINKQNIISYKSLNRLIKEFKLCSEDEDLSQIITKFELEKENNFYKWIVSMKGGIGSPYEGGLFKISIEFPNDYPNHGPTFTFINKIYHTCVNLTEHYIKGFICLSSTNEWRITGKVKNRKIFMV